MSLFLVCFAITDDSLAGRVHSLFRIDSLEVTYPVQVRLAPAVPV